MPLPNYGFGNKETKKKQSLVFESPPQLTDDGRKARIDTHNFDIDVERKLVFKDPSARDREAWRAPNRPGRDEIDDARRFKAPQRQSLRREVRSELDDLISEDKLRQIKAQGRPRMGDHANMNYDYSNGHPSSFSSPPSRKSSAASTVSNFGGGGGGGGRKTSTGSIGSSSGGRAYPMQEKTRAGVAIHPDRGSYQLYQVSSSSSSTTRMARTLY